MRSLKRFRTAPPRKAWESLVLVQTRRERMFGESRAFKAGLRPTREQATPMINLAAIKTTPRDEEEVLSLLAQGCSHQEIAGSLYINPGAVKTAPAHVVPARRNHRRPHAGQAGDHNRRPGGDGAIEPRDQLTTKEIQVSTRVWEGLS
jgi:hypothetical protein